MWIGRSDGQASAKQKPHCYKAQQRDGAREKGPAVLTVFFWRKPKLSM